MFGSCFYRYFHLEYERVVCNVLIKIMFTRKLYKRLINLVEMVYPTKLLHIDFFFVAGKRKGNGKPEWRNHSCFKVWKINVDAFCYNFNFISFWFALSRTRAERNKDQIEIIKSTAFTVCRMSVWRMAAKYKLTY